MKKLKIGIYCIDQDSFQKIKNEIQYPWDVQWFDALKASRLYYVNQNPGQWILFLDHDCRLPEKTLQWLQEFMSKKSENTTNQVISGCYCDPVNAKYLQKVHNYLANSWLLQNSQSRLLGGAFLVYSNVRFSNEEMQQNHFWGGEDQHLACLLVRAEFNLNYESLFCVEHQTSSAIKHFLKRALIHGRHWEKEQIKFKNLKLKRSYFTRKLSYWPGIGLHFLFFSIGRLFAQARPVRRLKN